MNTISITATLSSSLPDSTLFNHDNSSNSSSTTGEGTDVDQMIVYGILFPVIVPAGIFLNACSFIVLNQPTMRSSINLYLAALSFFDGLLLFLSLIMYPALAYCESDSNQAINPASQSRWTHFWCTYLYSSGGLTYPLSCMAHSGSVWTMVTITIDRFIAIKWPLQAKDWLTTDRARFFIIITAVWSVLYNLPLFFELTFNEKGELVVAPFRLNPYYVTYYREYCYLIFMFAGPALVSIILNVFVTQSVRRAYKVRQRLSGREEKERRCTLTAILVVGTFLILNLLALLNNFLENIVKGDWFRKLTFVGNFMVVLNSLANFVIYCVLGNRFRRMFCKLFCNRCYRSDKNDVFQRSSLHYGSTRRPETSFRHMHSSNAIHNWHQQLSTMTSSTTNGSPQPKSIIKQSHNRGDSANNNNCCLNLAKQTLVHRLQGERNSQQSIAYRTSPSKYVQRRPLLLVNTKDNTAGSHTLTVTSIFKSHLGPPSHVIKLSKNISSDRPVTIISSSRSLNLPEAELAEPLIPLERRGHSLGEKDSKQWWLASGAGRKVDDETAFMNCSNA